MDIRYNLQHIGDIFVDAVKNTADLASQSAKSVILTFDINRLVIKKNTLSRTVGERVSVLVKEGVIDVNKDDKLNELIAELNKIEKNLVELKDERTNVLNVFKPGK